MSLQLRFAFQQATNSNGACWVFPPPFWARSVLVSAEPGFQSNSREKGGSVRPLKPIKLRRLGFWRGGGRNGGGVRYLKTQFIWILNVNVLENQKLFVDVKAGFVLQIRESATIDANCSKKTTHSTLQKKKKRGSAKSISTWSTWKWGPGANRVVYSQIPGIKLEGNQSKRLSWIMCVTLPHLSLRVN